MNDTKTLALYPGQQEIDTLQHRIRDLLPGADKFSDAVLTALAQISLAHNLDPFIGEVWIIPTKRGPRIRAGIEGHRKAARKQSPYQIRQRQMTGPERDAHGLHDKQIAAVTEIYRTDSRIDGQAYIPTQGFGIWSPGENVARTKTPLWMAYKRSEQDALRRAFDLPFVSEENGNGQPPSAHVGPPGAPPAIRSDPTSPPEPAGSARAAAAELYGDYDEDIGSVHPDDLKTEQQATIDARLSNAPTDPITGQPPPARILNTETGEITEQPTGEPPLDKWGSFRSPAAAITWATRQGAFDNVNQARDAYDTLKADARPKNAQGMAQLWRAHVSHRLDEQAVGQAPEALAS